MEALWFGVRTTLVWAVFQTIPPARIVWYRDYVCTLKCDSVAILLNAPLIGAGTAMAQQVQGTFGYKTVQLIKTKQLGTGSYGAVYKAKCDDLPCAAKILHPTLFQFNDPEAMTVMRQFEQECNFLSAIRHPNIVQYLGSYQDPETQLPVLLMELMDVNLTQFLERSREPLPYHVQVDLCHDISLALAYLHSNDIIHRDLSSNNVLLIGAGYRSKVTDFGMAKLFDVNRTTLTPLTMCPGTLAYMSPEALDDPPVYTKKLDCFSFGILDIQIVTRQFPDPGPRTMKVQDPRSPTGRMDMPVLETERRRSHIDLISPTHPLLPIATDCLSYNEDDRPSAQKLCHCLATLKEAPQYTGSVQQAQETNTPAQSTAADREYGERLIRELQQEKEEPQEDQDQQTQNLRQQLLHDKDRVIEARERHVRELIQQLAANEQVTAQFQQNLLQKEKFIQDLQEEIQHLRQESCASLTSNEEVFQRPVAAHKEKLKFNMSWKVYMPAPYATMGGSAVVHDNQAFFRTMYPVDVAIPRIPLQVYNSDTEVWSTQPRPVRESAFTLTVCNSLVTAVGGHQSTTFGCEITNTLLCLVPRAGYWARPWQSAWMKYFPPMPTKRSAAAVVCSGKALVVAGGVGWSWLPTVEVMNTDTLQWSSACSLPYPLKRPSAIVCGDNVYLVGEGKLALTCSLSSLLQSQTVATKMETLSLADDHQVWHTIADLPVEHSTCVALNGQLLAVGGRHSDNRNTNAIYTYKAATNSWEVISHMPTARSDCHVVVLPSNKLMVVGGRGEFGVTTRRVEIASLL